MARMKSRLSFSVGADERPSSIAGRCSIELGVLTPDSSTKMRMSLKRTRFTRLATVPGVRTREEMNEAVAAVIDLAGYREAIGK
jgi:hypothetical protein